MHKDSTSYKAEIFLRFASLCGGGGVFWAAMWEARVDREDKIKVPRKSDQWVQRARSVHLAALWLCGRAASETQL